MVLLGITGTDGAGKGTVVERLVSHYGFVHCSARALLTEALEAEGKPTDRVHLREKANALRRAHGDDYLVRAYHARAEAAGWERIVVDSVRARAEATTLRALGGTLIAVDADVRVRYERISLRGASSDNISFEEFVRHEELEMNDPDPNGMQKAEVMRMADHTCMNNGTREELIEAVDALMDAVGIRARS